MKPKIRNGSIITWTAHSIIRVHDPRACALTRDGRTDDNIYACSLIIITIFIYALGFFSL